MNDVLSYELERTAKDIHIFLSKLSGKTILITGATGFIGSMLTRLFLVSNMKYGTDINIICSVRNIEKAEALFSNLKNSEQLVYITNGLVACNDSVDYIFHTAAPTTSKFFVTQPVETLNGSISTTLDVLQYATKNRVKKIVYLSSMEQYGIQQVDYQNMTEDLVRAKNRLHKVLQVTFPELENLLSTPTGEQYWNLVMAFPCKEFVLSLSQSDLYEIIRQSTSKRISEKRIAYLTDKLIKLAKQSFCAVKKTSPMLEEVRYYAQELLRLSERRQVVLNDMVALAQPLPEYDILRSIPGIAETTATSIIGELGDIRRFQSTNQINAFIGIDLRHYESGNFLAKEHITKRGNPYARKILFKCIHNIASASHTNPCHIADFYEKRKRQSQTTSTKPHTIASMHRLIQTMYYLITHNKLYDYSLTQNR